MELPESKRRSGPSSTREKYINQAMEEGVGRKVPDTTGLSVNERRLTSKEDRAEKEDDVFCMFL